MQQLKVQWDSGFSEPFTVSNSVRQGSILSLILFSVHV